VLAVPALGQAASSTGWAQYQGGPTHPGSIARGPTAPYAVADVTPFQDLPGGSSLSLGLSAPVVLDETAVVVGPTFVRAVSLGDGGTDWTMPRVFGPSVPAAIEATDGTAARAHPVVVYTEGWGNGPGNPTSSATPTTSVRPGSGSASPSAAPSPTAAAGSESASPSAGTPAPAVASDVMARSLVDGSKEWDAPVQLKATSRTGVTIDGSTGFVGDIRGNVYAIDLTDGTLRWTVNVGGFLESPIALADGHLVVSVDAYATGTTARVVSLSEDTGDVDWHYDSGHAGYLTAPTLADGRAFFGLTSLGAVASVPSLVALDLKGGSLIWESHLTTAVTPATSPTVAGSRVFLEDASGNVVAVERSTGHLDWTFALNSLSSQGATIVIGGQVLVPTDHGTIVVIDATSGHEVFVSADAGGPLHFPAPVGTDRVLFTRGGPSPGLTILSNDPSAGALTDVVSPTTPNYGRIIGNFAIAAALICACLLGLFLPLARRMGPAFLVDEDGELEAIAGGEDA
jgi:outer membrane protein assembly factor BamB